MTKHVAIGFNSISGMVSKSSLLYLLSRLRTDVIYTLREITYENLHELNLDIVLFDGGSDISPSLYGQTTKMTTYINKERDAFEVAIYNQFVKQSTLFAGICRGHQLLNALTGGCLYQDILADLGIIHRGGHIVTIENESNLHSYLMHYKDVRLNSLHHQSINTVGEDSIVTCISIDGVIEGFENSRCRGLQCHPEMMSGEIANNLMRYLLWEDIFIDDNSL